MSKPGPIGMSTNYELVASSDLRSAKEKVVKSELLTALFKTILEKFADTDAFIKADSPTLFLVYAHDNSSIGKADAALARDLIFWLNVLRSKVISDRSLSLEPWVTREDDDAAYDVLSNQFCLLPKNGNAESSDNISRVDKVILCCSEVLQSYHEDIRMKAYTQAIEDFYISTKRDPSSTDDVKKGIERIVRTYQYKEGFHHVLTELAFLKIRTIQEDGHHGIIPVVFSGDGIKSLPFFNSGVPLWLKPQEHSKSMIHECQTLHRLLFNLLRKIYTDKCAYIDAFNDCYEKCAKMLSPVSALPSLEEFNGLVSVEIKLTVDRLIKHGLTIIRTATAGKYSKAAVLDSCLRSLAYPEMNYRRQDTKRAHENTCGWITCHQSYIDWLREGSGILWIKGKPGSGKSTLMEALLRDYEKQAVYKESIQLSFFVHGRGTALQKSRLGMFRSLLHQLLIKAPEAGADIQRAFEERSRTQGNSEKDWNWHVNELREFFISAVVSVANTQPVNIFVDALDEAGDGIDSKHASYDIVTDFHQLNDCLHQTRLRSTICFSCRHFPVLLAKQRWEIWVENENRDDISRYVYDELNERLSLSAENQHVMEWQNTISNEAQGVFQWAALVVDMTVRHYNHGRLPKETREMLAKVPKELSKVYKHILSEVIDKEDNQRTLRLMRWVLLAERPLTVEEGRFAMYLPDKEILAPRSSVELELPTINMMVKQIVSLSGGLIECKEHKKSQIIQFIHQSVNDFLSREGLGLLDATSRENSIGQGHHQLSLICANYMKLTEMDNLGELSIDAIKARLPFMDYAARSWFLHAEKAETRGVPQGYLLPLSQHCPEVLQHWVMLYRMLDSGNYSARTPGHNSTMLHIASGANLLSVVKGLLSTSPYLEQMDGSGNRALHHASRWGHAKVVKVLLVAGAIVDAQNHSKYTALERAAANGHEEVVPLLLAIGAEVNKQAGATGSALYGSAIKGSIAIVKVLLDHNAEVNAQGGQYGNALQAAAYSGHQAIVQLLLDNNAEVNAQGGQFGNALQAAAYEGHQAIVQLLLDNNAEVNAQGGEFGNALQAAAYSGHQEIVQLLLDNNAEVNAQSGQFGNALQAAAYEGHQEIVQLLLDNNAEVNAQSGQFGNALQAAAAAYKGYHEIVQLLLDNNAEVNAQSGEYGNALQAAAYKGHQEIVQLLLDNNAKVNAQSGRYSNALQAAAYSGHQEIVQLLLDNNAEVNAQGGQFGNALQAAAYESHQEIVQLLLDNNAEVNAQGGQFGNALQAAAAAYKGYHEIVQLLLDNNAEVNAQNGEFGNALQAAAYEGHQTIVRLLLDNNAEVNAQGGQYGNALQAAAYSGHQVIVRLLLHKGASMICQDNQGRCPIQLAIRGNHDTLINLLLANIGTPNWKYQDQQGCSALHFAASGGSDRTVQMILKSDADINLPDTCGWTPLHWACRSGNRKTIQMLKDSGADLNRKDMKGWTPLDVAMFCWNGSLGDLLQEETNQAEPKQIITKPGERQYYSCSSCYHDIYGSRHNCKKCGFFNLCFRCITDADRIHEPGHTFEVIDR